MVQIADVLLRKRDVLAQTGLAHTTFHALIRSGDFPAPLRLSPRCVAWKRSEICAWINTRPPARAILAKSESQGAMQ